MAPVAADPCPDSPGRRLVGRDIGEAEGHPVAGAGTIEGSHVAVNAEHRAPRRPRAIVIPGRIDVRGGAPKSRGLPDPTGDPGAPMGAVRTTPRRALHRNRDGGPYQGADATAWHARERWVGRHRNRSAWFWLQAATTWATTAAALGPMPVRWR